MASDLSVFHRVDDWRELPSSRFFAWAERLPHYDGAVRHVLMAAMRAEGVPAAATASARQPVIEDMSLMAAISNHSGFPGIDYVGGVSRG